MVKRYALLALALPVSFAFAELRDPRQVLPQIRAFTGMRSFHQAFQCGDTSRATVLITSCEFLLVDGTIQSTCYGVNEPQGVPVQRSVYNCSDDVVSILTDLTGDSADLTRVDFEAAHSSPTENFLTNAAAFAGYPVNLVTLTGVQPTTYALETGSVPALNIAADLGEDPYRISILITVVQNVPGVAEVVRFRTGVTTWFKVTGFQRSPP